MIICKHKFSKICNKNIVFICNTNFKLIFLFDINIKLSNFSHQLKLQIFIFLLKKYKTNIKRFVASSNFTKNV